MDQMADEIIMRADVKDKERVNTAEESTAWVTGANEIFKTANTATSNVHLYDSFNSLERIKTETQVNVRRLSAAAENERGETSKDADAQQSRERSPSPLFSLKMYLRRSSSTESPIEGSLSSSQQSNTGVDCAGIVLNCLFCRFYDMMLPDSRERVANSYCPNHKQASTTAASTPSSDGDFWTDLDCGLFTSCQDANDCLELAMEVSEICYH